MASRKKNDSNQFTSWYPYPSSGRVMKEARKQRKKAAKMGTPVGPSKVDAGTWGKGTGKLKGKSFISTKTNVYSNSGTGKGTTGKKSEVTISKRSRFGPDKTTVKASRKLNQPRKRKK